MGSTRGRREMRLQKRYRMYDRLLGKKRTRDLDIAESRGAATSIGFLPTEL